MNAIFDVSPIPPQTMRSGSVGGGGIGGRSSTMGASRWRTTGRCPAGSPRASARRAPVAKPTTTRSSVAATWPQSWPVAASSATFPRTRHGPARKIGLKRFPRTTSPDARLHTRRKATTAPARRTHARPRGSGAPWSPHSTRSVTVFTNMTSSRRAHGVTASAAAAVWWTYLTRGAAGQDGAEALYCAAMGDLLLRRGVVDGRRRDVAIRDGRIHRLGVDLDPTGYDALDVTDKLVVPGFVESHIHPDKAFIADRTEGLRAGGPSAQTLVAELKKTFTVDDIYRRARRVMELAVRHGCTTRRAHAEVDAYVQLRGAQALRRWQAELAGARDRWPPRYARRAHARPPSTGHRQAARGRAPRHQPARHRAAREGAWRRPADLARGHAHRGAARGRDQRCPLHEQHRQPLHPVRPPRPPAPGARGRHGGAPRKSRADGLAAGARHDEPRPRRRARGLRPPRGLPCRPRRPRRARPCAGDHRAGGEALRDQGRGAGRAEHADQRGADAEIGGRPRTRSEEHTSELQSQSNLVCRLLLEKKKK